MTKCAICYDDDSVIPYTTIKVTACDCKFHADCIDYILYAPIFRYRTAEGEKEPQKLCINHCDRWHGRSIDWHNLKSGPFIWRRSDGTIKAEGFLKELKIDEEGRRLNGIIMTKCNTFARNGKCYEYAYVLHGLYKEYDTNGTLIRSMNYNDGEVIGTFKTHSDVQMKQEMAPGGKVHGLRQIQLEDGTQITENWRYGVIHGPRTIRWTDGSETVEEYENGYLINPVEPKTSMWKWLIHKFF